MKKIEEALMMEKMKNGERRDEDEEDERGSCTVWVGVRLRPSYLVATLDLPTPTRNHIDYSKSNPI